MYINMVTLVFSDGAAGSLDHRLPKLFQNGTVRPPRIDSVTLQSLRDVVDSDGYTYTFTITLDPKRKKFKKELINQPKKQWRHIKKVLLTHVDRYKFRSIMVPEFHKNSTRVHAHGIVHFKVENYDQACLKRSQLVTKLHKECGQEIQWTRINESLNSYMPSESNIKIKEKQSLRTWHKYMHKDQLRLSYGIQDLVNF